MFCCRIQDIFASRCVISSGLFLSFVVEATRMGEVPSESLERFCPLQHSQQRGGASQWTLWTQRKQPAMLLLLGEDFLILLTVLPQFVTCVSPEEAGRKGKQFFLLVRASKSTWPQSVPLARPQGKENWFHSLTLWASRSLTGKYSTCLPKGGNLSLLGNSANAEAALRYRGQTDPEDRLENVGECSRVSGRVTVCDDVYCTALHSTVVYCQTSLIWKKIWELPYFNNYEGKGENKRLRYLRVIFEGDPTLPFFNNKGKFPFLCSSCVFSFISREKTCERASSQLKRRNVHVWEGHRYWW